jgi:Superfamily II DNA and RNA helicases
VILPIKEHRNLKDPFCTFSDLHVDYFIGGTQVERPKRPVQIVVGSPGRIKQMIKLKYLNMDSVRLFIMDEADKLINTGFVEDIT